MKGGYDSIRDTFFVVVITKRKRLERMCLVLGKGSGLQRKKKGLVFSFSHPLWRVAFPFEAKKEPLLAPPPGLNYLHYLHFACQAALLYVYLTCCSRRPVGSLFLLALTLV
jgi:hypothetical protein